MKEMLKKAAIKAVELLVKVVMKGIERRTFKEEQATMAASFLTALGMKEELFYFSMFVRATYVRIGKSLPSAFAEVAAAQAVTKSEPASTVKTVVAPPAPPPVKVQPPRTLASQSQRVVPENLLLNWRNFLQQFVGNEAQPGRDNLVKRTSELSIQLFTSGLYTKIDEAGWALLFSGMSRAHEIRSHLVGESCNISQTFKVAPVELLQDYVFGPEGELHKIVSEISQIPPGKLEGRQFARMHQCASLIEVIDDVYSLTDHNVQMVQDLCGLLKNKGVRGGVLDKFEALCYEGESEELSKIHEAAKVENKPLAALENLKKETAA